MVPGAVLTTIISFLVSQQAIDLQLKKAEAYYLRGDQAALTKSRIARATDWLNATSGVLFVLGVSLTTTFVVANFERGSKMSTDKEDDRVQLRQAAPIPMMQEAPLKKGAPIPDFQQIPKSPQPQSEPPAQTTPSAPPDSSTPSGDSKK